MIFAVDDDRQLLDALVETLEADGYFVQAFDSAMEAIDALDSQWPELIISDIRMPGMDGFAFHRAVRQKPGASLVPFLFLSSLDEPSQIVQGLDAGVDDYVTKPVEWKILAARVRAILRRAAGRSGSDGQPAFVGDLAKLPFVKVMQFCEVRGLTGRVRILSGDVDVEIRFEHGEMAYDDETADMVGGLLALVEGRFEIHVVPVDFGQIGHAAVTPSKDEKHADGHRQPLHDKTASKSPPCPMGRLSGVRRNGKLIQVQTECTPQPDPMVVSVAILDGRTIIKQTAAVPDVSDRASLVHLIRAQHDLVERQVAEQVAQEQEDEPRQSVDRLALFNRLFEQGLDFYMAGEYEQA